MPEIEIYHKRGIFKFDTIEELLTLKDVKWNSDRPDFYEFALAPDSYNSGRIGLMSMNDRTDEYGGCSRWWLVGDINGSSVEELGLPLWKDRVTNHKPDCWHHKYLSIMHMLDYRKPSDFNMKFLKDAGWHKDDSKGCAAYCDCGYISHFTKTLDRTYYSDKCLSTMTT